MSRLYCKTMFHRSLGRYSIYYKMIDVEFLDDYNLPDFIPTELQLILLEYSGHVRRGLRSISYIVYF